MSKSKNGGMSGMSLSTKDMDSIEKKMQDIVDEDAFLKGEEGMQWLCVPRISVLRQRTELLGSVEAVEGQFAQAGQGVAALQKIAASVTASARQYTATALALQKARKAEKAAQEREEKKRDAQKARKEKAQQAQQQAQTRRGKNEEGSSQAGQDGEPGETTEKKRRAPANAGFAETDPAVLTSLWPSGNQVVVKESFASCMNHSVIQFMQSVEAALHDSDGHSHSASV